MENTYSLDVQIERYFVEAKAKAGLRVAPIPKYIKDYEAAAAKCKTLDATVEDYMQAILANVNIVEMRPTHLHSKYVEGYYSEYISKKRKISFEDKYKANVDTYMAFRSKGFSEEEILLTSFVFFDPWFRICYPRSLNQKILTKFKKEGQETYCAQLRDLLVTKGHDYTRLL